MMRALRVLWTAGLLAAASAVQAGPNPAPITTPTPAEGPAPVSRPVPQAVMLNGKPFPAVTPFVARIASPKRTLFVSSVAENGDGSEKHPWNDLQSALCALQPGDRLRVLAGTYTGEFRVAEPCRDGTRRAPIQVFFDGKARLVPGGDDTAFTIRKSHWHLAGLFLDLGQSTGLGVSIEGPEAHDVTLDGARISGGAGPSVRIGEGASGIRIANSRIAKSRLEHAEPAATGVEIAAGARDVLLTRSRLHDNPGGSVRVRAPAVDGRAAAGVQILGNTIHDDAATAIDVQAAEGLRVTGNTIFDGPGVPGTRGIALGRVLHGIVRGNHVSDCEVAIQVGRANPAGGFVGSDDVTVDRNFLDNTLSPGVGVRIEAGRLVRFVNNIVERTADAILVLGGPPRTQAISVANNLVLAVSGIAFTLEDPKAAALFDSNVFSPRSDPVDVQIGDRKLALEKFLKGGTMPSTRLIPGVLILNRDLARISGVAAVDQGKAVQGVPYRGKAPDLGVEER